jgi:hypothetical protein
MSWAKLDDRFHENPKILGLDHSAFRLYVCGLTYSCAHETAGHLSSTVVSALMRLQRITGTATVTLVAAGCWTQEAGEFKIHDFEKYQFTKPYELTVQARRTGGLKSVQARIGKYGSANPRAQFTGTPEVAGEVTSLKTRTRPVPSFTSENKETGETLETKERSVSPNGSTSVVFEAWITSTGKTGRTRLDNKRRRLITQALESYPLEDVLDAVDGWKNVAHNRGENDRHRKFNSLELLLRDAEHIETFRDAKRNAGAMTTAGEVPGDYAYQPWQDPYAAEEAARRG